MSVIIGREQSMHSNCRIFLIHCVPKKTSSILTSLDNRKCTRQHSYNDQDHVCNRHYQTVLVTTRMILSGSTDLEVVDAYKDTLWSDR